MTDKGHRVLHNKTPGGTPLNSTLLEVNDGKFRREIWYAKLK